MIYKFVCIVPLILSVKMDSVAVAETRAGGEVMLEPWSMMNCPLIAKPNYADICAQHQSGLDALASSGSPLVESAQAKLQVPEAQQEPQQPLQRDVVVQQLREALATGDIVQIAAAAKGAIELKKLCNAHAEEEVDQQLMELQASVDGQLAKWRHTVGAGHTIDIYDSKYGQWFEAKVLEINHAAIVVHYLGWNSYVPVFLWELVQRSSCSVA